MLVKKKAQSITKIKLIYNPQAGKKWHHVRRGRTLEDLQKLFVKYELDVDYYPILYRDHASELAKKAVLEGYNTVVVAGGDRTVSEVARAMVGCSANIGILPIGNNSNINRIFAIPFDLEKAIIIIKLQKIKQIDFGVINLIDGKKLKQPFYFMDSAEIGIEALLNKYFNEFERGDIFAMYRVIRLLVEFYSSQMTIELDDQTIFSKATLCKISNLIDDKLLNVVLYRMSKKELITFFFKLLFKKPISWKKVSIYNSKKVQIRIDKNRLIYADGNILGNTPAEFKIMPKTLNIICGFPDQEISMLKKRTYLNP